jgi:hypothetical protein
MVILIVIVYLSGIGFDIDGRDTMNRTPLCGQHAKFCRWNGEILRAEATMEP